MASRKTLSVPIPKLDYRPAVALRRALSLGYGKIELRRDVLAGLVVGVVALPLSMALAIASGVPPQHGLYTAVIAGALIALLGGSKTQVSGPTAAFVVILVPITAKFGIGGLCIATLMAGIILVIFGLARLGQLLQYVPFPVTSGFTAGIGVVIATLQLKDFFGLEVANMPEHYVERVWALVLAFPTLHWDDLLIGALTLAILLAWPMIKHKHAKLVPAPLVALVFTALLAFVLSKIFAGFDVATIGSRYGGIPQAPPLPVLPWMLSGANGEAMPLNWALIRTLLPSAFAIAMLGAIESLLSATVADGMAGTKHDPNAELVGQGIGNIVAPFFAGFAATGAIARTATNVRAGARSPIAAITHSVFILAAMLILAPLVAFLPMAALAALLMLVAWNMSDAKAFGHTVRVAPRSDVLVLLACFSLTVLFDMVISVTVGIVMAALLFMRRMAEISGARLFSESHHELNEKLPPGVIVYEIAGPLFFGAARNAMASLDATTNKKVKVVIFDIADVPVIDATGIVAFESTLQRLRKSKIFVIICGAREQPASVLEDAEIRAVEGELAFVKNVRAGIDRAKALAEVSSPGAPAPGLPVVAAAPTSAGAAPADAGSGASRPERENQGPDTVGGASPPPAGDKQGPTSF